MQKQLNTRISEKKNISSAIAETLVTLPEKREETNLQMKYRPLSKRKHSQPSMGSMDDITLNDHLNSLSEIEGVLKLIGPEAGPLEITRMLMAGGSMSNTRKTINQVKLSKETQNTE